MTYLLDRLKGKDGLKEDDCLIEPRDTWRKTLMEYASRAFTHCWNQLVLCKNVQPQGYTHYAYDHEIW